MQSACRLRPGQRLDTTAYPLACYCTNCWETYAAADRRRQEEEREKARRDAPPARESDWGDSDFEHGHIRLVRDESYRDDSNY